MYINEIFYSIQGEGLTTGKRTVFIRTAGCNLRCTWCDTKYAYSDGKEYTVDELLKTISKFDCNDVSVTGGEPLIQKDIYKLIDKLLKSKKNVLLETGGSISIKELRNSCNSDRLMISMDIKCPSSKMDSKNCFSNIRYLRKIDQLKFVIQNRNDYDYAKRVIKKYRPKCEIILQPEFSVSAKISQSLVEWILEDKLDVRLMCQMHKNIGLR